MNFHLLLYSIAFLSQFSTAYPSLGGLELEERAAKPSAHKWIPVQAGGLRSPCPGTNTLANHGFINRDGRNITQKAYRNAFLQAFGMSANATNDGLNGIFLTCKLLFNGGNKCSSINLDMLSAPHRQEHDGSLTRDDAKTLWNQNGDNHSFNQSVWDRSKAAYSILGNITHLNTQTANTMFLRRVEQAVADDPGWFLFHQHGSIDEHSFYLTTMNDPTLGQDRLVNPQARLDWVDHWFEKEELPTALGWVKPSIPITNLGALSSVIIAQPTLACQADCFPQFVPPTTTQQPTSTSISTLTSFATSSGAVSSPTTTAAVVPPTSFASSSAFVASAPTVSPAPPRKRDSVPLAAIPSIAAKPEGREKVRAAARAARAESGKQPVVPDLYETTLTDSQYVAIFTAVDAYVAKMQQALKENLAAVVG